MASHMEHLPPTHRPPPPPAPASSSPGARAPDSRLLQQLPPKLDQLISLVSQLNDRVVHVEKQNALILARLDSLDDDDDASPPSVPPQRTGAPASSPDKSEIMRKKGPPPPPPPASSAGGSPAPAASVPSSEEAKVGRKIIEQKPTPTPDASSGASDDAPPPLPPKKKRRGGHAIRLVSTPNKKKGVGAGVKTTATTTTTTTTAPPPPVAVSAATAKLTSSVIQQEEQQKHLRGMGSFDFINLSNADELSSMMKESAGAGATGAEVVSSSSSSSSSSTDSPPVVPRHRPAASAIPTHVASSTAVPHRSASTIGSGDGDGEEIQSTTAPKRVDAIQKQTKKRRPLSAQFGRIFRRGGGGGGGGAEEDTETTTVAKPGRLKRWFRQLGRKVKGQQDGGGDLHSSSSDQPQQKMILLDDESDMFVFSNRSLQVVPRDEIQVLEQISPSVSGDAEEEEPLVVVHKGEWNRQTVAIKFFDPVKASNDHSGAFPAPHIWSFFQKNIVRILGVTRQDEKIGILSEWMSNTDLKRYILAHPNELRFADKVKCLLEVLEACEYLHDRDFIIRELRTSSILVGQLLTNPKISLYSLAQIMKREGKTSDKPESQGFAEVGGASHYRAPEILLAKPATAAVDLFSFAVIMFEVYYENFRPFGNSGEGLDLQIALNPNLRPRIDMDAVPVHHMWFVTAMQACWDSDPGQRPSFAEVKEIFRVENKKLLFTSFAAKVEDERAAMPVGDEDDDDEYEDEEEEEGEEGL